MVELVRKKLNANDSPFSRRIFIYGDSGSGKTSFAGSAQDVPEMRNVLVGDIDNSSKSLVSRGDLEGYDTRDVATVRAITDLFRRKAPEVAGFNTVVYDNYSELQKRDLADIAKTEAAKPSSNRAKPREADRNELLDYKLNYSRMLNTFRDVRDIPARFVIATAWAKKAYPKDAEGKAIPNSKPSRIMPDLPDGIRDSVLGMFDDVFYIYTVSNNDGDASYYLVTSSCSLDGTTVVAKTRDSALAKLLKGPDGKPILKNATMAQIFAAYRECYNLKG